MTEVINIPDRERAKDALILQLSEGRDKLAARVEALEGALRCTMQALEYHCAQTRPIDSTDAALNFAGASLKESQT